MATALLWGSQRPAPPAQPPRCSVWEAGELDPYRRLYALTSVSFSTACKRKEMEIPKQEAPAPKKPRLVFTDIQRRTLMAIFKETKRPSKEMQATIAEQLGLKVSTVANFFMNARRRSLDKYTEDGVLLSPDSVNNNVPMSPPPHMQAHGMQN